MDRRQFLRLTASLSAAVPAWPASREMQATAPTPITRGASPPPILDLAEWTNGYIGLETVTLARGEIHTGKYLYAEIFTPRNLRRAYPVILVHGGNSQGLDWLTTPDGRRGWALMLVEQGYRVYVIDRPGQGRPPYSPDLHGPYADAFGRPPAPTYEQAIRNVIASDVAGHTQWPGSGQIGDRALDQFMGSQGPALPNAMGAETAWRFSGAKLLDETGPAIFITHGDGATFAWVAADERPDLVKAIVALEPPAPSPGGRGMVVAGVIGAGEVGGAPSETPGIPGAGPAPVVAWRGGGVANAPTRLTVTPVSFEKLTRTAVAIVTGDASPGVQRDPQSVAYLRQVSLQVDHVRLADAGVRGNGAYPMLEKNNRDALAPVVAWLERRVLTGAPAPPSPPVRPNNDSTALRLADHDYLFVGIERKKIAYGTVAFGHSGVQVFTPAEVRHPYPVIMVHGGGGQAVHMMGIGRRPGWAHYFVREGYRTYVMDRPASGRVPHHADTFGDDYWESYGGAVGSAGILGNSRLAPGNPRGTGLLGEDVGLQFAANEQGRPRSMALHSEQWARGAVELLDRIGPAILLTHAYGGALGWIAADRRPNLVKAIVTVEGNNDPFAGQVVWGLTAVPLEFDPPVGDPREFRLTEWTPPAGSPGPIRPFRIQAEPARQLKNLRGIPIMWLQGENPYAGPAQVQFLKQSGCDAELVRLRDRGIEDGNTNLMLLERNNFEVFAVIRDWLNQHLRA